MCGIAGMIDYAGIDGSEAALSRMMASLKNRGPDQDGTARYRCAGLVHTRLAVVDIENGRQPMIFQEGNRHLCLVYNGELYNTEEIRALLKAHGHRFRGHSDTEVLLKAYAQWGEECVHLLNGIFAFAVWDEEAETLFIARDRIGVKPFFYALHHGAFYFASEIKAILSHGAVRPIINADSVAEIILMGPGRTPGCGVFKGIQELPPGCCGFFSRDGFSVKTYWSLRDRVHDESFEKTVERTAWLVEDAIRRQLVSDVPVCTFLSGGLDSSIISTVAARHLAEKGTALHTFSVHYEDNEKYFKASKFQPDSDDRYIEIMQRWTNSTHHKIIIDTPRLVEALYGAVDARDLPGMADVDASLLVFCQEVKKYATVALSGECADEIFGGYPWYRDETIRDSEGFPWAQSAKYRLSFLKEDLLAATGGEAYIQKRYQDTLEATHALPGLSQKEKRLREMVNLNFTWFMQTLLDRKDRMSMAHGLEVRVPFCDYRIAEYLYAVPWDFKDYMGREKGLLRKAMAPILPEEIIHRKKSPYPKTFNPGYLKAVSRLLREIIQNPDSPLLQIVRKEALEALLESDMSVPWYGQLMTTPQTIAYFVQVNYWMEKYAVTLA